MKLDESFLKESLKTRNMKYTIGEIIRYGKLC